MSRKTKPSLKKMRGYNFWDQVINDCIVHLAVVVNSVFFVSPLILMFQNVNPKYYVVLGGESLKKQQGYEGVAHGNGINVLIENMNLSLLSLLYVRCRYKKIIQKKAWVWGQDPVQDAPRQHSDLFLASKTMSNCQNFQPPKL